MTTPPSQSPGADTSMDAAARGGDDPINPRHYTGSAIQPIDAIEAWGLGFCLGNAVKYISRAGKKSDPALQDLKKARWYLDREIANMEKPVAKD